MSSSRPWNRLRNGTGPSGPTTSTVPSNSTIGSRRRAAARASPSWVWAFSRTRSSSRAACQVARSTTGGRPGSAVVRFLGVVVIASSGVSRAGGVVRRPATQGQTRDPAGTHRGGPGSGRVGDLDDHPGRVLQCVDPERRLGARTDEGDRRPLEGGVEDDLGDVLGAL